ncbi:hypothetical protein BDZ90DRAFT_89908 [Jaminaea rosea]|uniref:FHA domain-containing protein n=1 Tax=Jaminaea rosea TaxID=1569628 RepID=A0A316ULZ3_9BASI|nr:hypothetical protein BDZ90DRAFT_89908 [Jaminaea rosea]PWN24953.1 hypothetical protein BDZ90DRAFT_89908 [Jaminaea rosea]
MGLSPARASLTWLDMARAVGAALIRCSALGWRSTWTEEAALACPVSHLSRTSSPHLSLLITTTSSTMASSTATQACVPLKSPGARLAIIVGYDAKRVWCKDLKSSHGTYVTRKNVEHKVPSNGLFELRSGDVISFGKDVTKGSSNFKAVKCRFSRYTSATIRSATVSKTTPVSTTSDISSASPSAPALAPAPVNPAHEAYKAKLAPFRAGVEKLSSYREAQKQDAAAVPTKPPELISLSPAKRAAQWVESVTPSQLPAGTPPSVGSHAAAAAGVANTSTATTSAPRPSGRYGLDIGNSQPNDMHEITKSTTATPLSAEKASDKAVADFVRRNINDLVATVSRKGATAESSASGSASASDSGNRSSASKDHKTDAGAPADASLTIKQECAGKSDEHAQSPNARLSDTQVVSTDVKSANSDGKSDGDNEEDEPRLSESNSACPAEDGDQAYNESRSSSHRDQSEGEDESASTKPASELNHAHRADAGYDDDEDLLDSEDDWSFNSDTQPIYDPSYEMGSPAVLARYEAAFNEAWDRWLEKGVGMKRNGSRARHDAR